MVDPFEVSDVSSNYHGDSTAAVSPAQWQALSGFEDFAQSARSYNEARRNGERDKDTDEILGVQPQFFDSSLAAGKGNATAAKNGTDVSRDSDYFAGAPAAVTRDYFAGVTAAPPKPIDVNAPARQLDYAVKQKIDDDPQVNAAYSKLSRDIAKLAPEQANKMQKSMDEIKERAASMKPPLEPQEVAKTYAEVAKLLEAKDNPKLPVTEADRRMLAEQVLRQAADPTAIDQGKHNTCNAASVEDRIYSRNPSAAAELVRQVATTGEYTTHGTPPHKIKIDPDSLAKHPGPDKNGKAQAEEAELVDGRRSYASQVFQVAAINVGHQTKGLDIKNPDGSVTHYPPDTVQYRQGDPTPGSKPPNDHGELLVDIKTGQPIKDARDNPIIFPKISDDRLVDMYNEISNKKGDKGVVIANGDYTARDGKNVTIIEDQAGLEKALSDAKKAGQMPVTIKVNAAREPFYSDSNGGQAGGSGGAHVVTVTDYDPTTGKVTIDNTWGKSADRDVDIKQLYKATQGPDDSVRSLEKEIAEDGAKGKVDPAKERELLRVRNDAGKLSDADYYSLTVKSLEKECADNAKNGKVNHLTELELLRIKHQGGMLTDAQYDTQLAWQTKQIVQDAKANNGGIIDIPTRTKLLSMADEIYSHETYPHRYENFKNSVWESTLQGVVVGNVKTVDTPDPKYDKSLPKDIKRLHEAADQTFWFNQEDYDNIYASLANKSPAQLAQMDKAFQAEYGQTIDDYLKDKLENHPAELKKAQDLLHPETVPAELEEPDDDRPQPVRRAPRSAAA